MKKLILDLFRPIGFTNFKSTQPLISRHICVDLDYILRMSQIPL